MFVNAVRLGRSLHGDVDRRTADILTRSHRLQMGRVDAFPDATEMVQLHPLRDGADERLVGDSVCHLRATRNIDETVAFLAHPLALPPPSPVPSPRPFLSCVFPPSCSSFGCLFASFFCSCLLIYDFFFLVL